MVSFLFLLCHSLNKWLMMTCHLCTHKYVGRKCSMVQVNQWIRENSTVSKTLLPPSPPPRNHTRLGFSRSYGHGIAEWLLSFWLYCKKFQMQFQENLWQDWQRPQSWTWVWETGVLQIKPFLSCHPIRTVCAAVTDWTKFPLWLLSLESLFSVDVVVLCFAERRRCDYTAHKWQGCWWPVRNDPRFAFFRYTWPWTEASSL